MSDETVPPSSIELQHFTQVVGGVFSVYDAPIEHFEHAVVFYNLGVLSEKLDTVQRLALWKASIIFCAMCLDAYWKQVGGSELKYTGRKTRGEKRGQEWKKRAASVGVKLDDGLMADVDNVIDYRNITLHSDTKHSLYLTRLTTEAAAYQAIQNVQKIYSHLHDVFGQNRPPLVNWMESIAAKAITPRSPAPP